MPQPAHFFNTPTPKKPTQWHKWHKWHKFLYPLAVHPAGMPEAVII